MSDQQTLQKESHSHGEQSEKTSSGSGMSMMPPAFSLSAQPVQRQTTKGPEKGEPVQQKIGDGHDLTSPRFANIEDLEAVYDGEKTLREGDSGHGVQTIQQCLYDLGYAQPTDGASGTWTTETTAAIRQYQSDRGIPVDGQLGTRTIEEMDKRFGEVTLDPAMKSAGWTPAGVKQILEPWSPHSVDLLRTRINLKSFDRVYWEDEEWDGSSWNTVIFEGGGYNNKNDIGIVNHNNEAIAETLYHELLHAEQPSSQITPLEQEIYAYRTGEEFSIAMGLGGRNELRSTNDQGREFADNQKVDSFVREHYPSVPAVGAPEDFISGKGKEPGTVEMTRPDQSTYDRPAEIGEVVPGPIRFDNPKDHDRAEWN